MDLGIAIAVETQERPKKCEHGRQRYRCKECKGCSICGHGKRRHRCRECKGCSICEHNRHKDRCKDCNISGYLISVHRCQIRRVLRAGCITKTKHSVEYLGCDSRDFCSFIESKMVEGMTLDNIHLDHIKPVAAFDMSNPDNFLDCCKYTNFQPLSAKDNMEKASRWSGADEEFWRESIRGKDDYREIYIPRR
jgi:hypothetical protein